VSGDEVVMELSLVIKQDPGQIRIDQGTPTFWKPRATSRVKMNTKGYLFDINFPNNTFA